MSSTSLVQSTSSNSLGRSQSYSQSQSPATRARIAPTHPIASLTPNKGLSTPSSARNASPAVSTPGRWQHPRMDEIVRRQDASCFKPGDSRIVVLNAGVMILAFIVHSYLPEIPIAALRNTPYVPYAIYTLQTILALNILLTLAPLWRTADACEDIPLTPQQRHALGLPPMSRPATPQEEAQYVTPPRYSRSATPRSSVGSANSFADSLRVQARASPLSGRGSPLDASFATGAGSPFGSARRGSGGGSPFSASPMKDKMLSGSDFGRRSSLGGSELGRRGSFSGSPRGSPLGGDSDGLMSQGPKSGKASVGLNSKWLYQKGRGSPGMGSGWGTGSVFN